MIMIGGIAEIRVRARISSSVSRHWCGRCREDVLQKAAMPFVMGNAALAMDMGGGGLPARERCVPGPERICGKDDKTGRFSWSQKIDE
jgi:hypothetical protein